MLVEFLYGHWRGKALCHLQLWIQCWPWCRWKSSPKYQLEIMIPGIPGIVGHKWEDDRRCWYMFCETEWCWKFCSQNLKKMWLTLPGWLGNDMGRTCRMQRGSFWFFPHLSYGKGRTLAVQLPKLGQMDHESLDRASQAAMRISPFFNFATFPAFPSPSVFTPKSRRSR